MMWKVSSAEIAGAVRKLNTNSAAITAQTQRKGLTDPSVNSQGAQNPSQAAPQATPITNKANSAEGGVKKPEF